MFRDRFDDDEDDDLKGSEFTLGLGSLLGIFFGMVLLCGIFFGIGYTLGHGSSPLHVTNPSAATPETPPAGTPSSTALTPGGAKPAAQQAAPPPPPAQPTPGQTATGTNPASGTTAGTAPATGAQSATAQPASVPQQSATAQPASSQTAQSAPLYMVQVAAVSRPQDAAVLVSALQQRGFQAVSRTAPQDHLMHVQIGPFATLAAANQMRARLMADGYNAILKP